MRGRSFWKDPPVASVCAFCAHRVGILRSHFPPHNQRRLLQTTRPTARPPATAATAREEQEDDESEYSVSSSSWEKPHSSKESSRGNHDGLSFGRAAASSAAPTFGLFSRPAFGTTTIDLTEEEKQAAARIKMQEERPNPRPITLFAGPGPGTHRSGRPEPAIPKPENPMLVRARQSHLANKHALTGSGEAVGGSSLATPVWGNLRRRNTELIADSTQPHLDHFAQDRAEREERAKSARYTPVTNRSIFDEREERPRDLRLQDSTSSHHKESRAKEEWALPNFRGEPISPAASATIEFGRPAFRSRGLESGEKGKETNFQFRVAGENTDIGPRPETRVKASGLYQPRRFGLEGSRYARSSDHSVSQGAFESRNPDFSKEGRRVTSRVSEGVYKPKHFGLPGTRRRMEGYVSEARIETNTRFNAVSGINNFPEKQVPLDESQIKKELDREREDRVKLRAEKYAAEALAQTERAVEAPRGREKDKSRRRQQFVTQYDEQEDENSAAAKAETRRQRKREKAARKAAAPTPVFLPEYITVANLALALKVRVEDFLKKMEELGFEETGYDFILNSENAGLIAQEYNFDPIIDHSESLDLKARPLPKDTSKLPSRAPVVTIMGHVDHGKTTLLDYLRKSSVAATEHGGITQHIGAFSVPMPSGKVITFLDTPGHAAFLNMRQRGANVTDIVILVVAADDSVKPQTIEAIKHARAAHVPMIVAVNKIDKEEANIDKVKQDLARNGVEIEDFGGDTQVVCVSGKTGQGMAELEEAALTLSEILDMRAEVDGPVEGWVLEASIKSVGKVATVLVRRGTMRAGDVIVAGNTWARIRRLRNEAGADIEEARPGTPVEIDGWKEQPVAGDEVIQAPSEQTAKSVVDYRNQQSEREKLAEDMEAINGSRKLEQEKRGAEKRQKILSEGEKAEVSQEPLIAKDATPKGPKQIYFIVKGDVSGSVEAVIDSISAVGSSEVQAHILRSGVGQLSEFDVEHAAAAKGFLVNFNVPIDPKLSSLAKASKVEIINHNIIYRLVDEVKAKMSMALPPLITTRVLGEAEVAQVFEINIKGRKHKAVAGCKVKNGVVAKNSKVRILRWGQKIFDGNINSLKNVKKDVLEMRKGSECGIDFDGWADFEVGDQIQSYESVEEKRYL